MNSETADIMKEYGKRNYSQATADASEYILAWNLTKRGLYAQKVSMTGFDIFAVDPKGNVFSKKAKALISVKAIGGTICGRLLKIDEMEKIADEMWVEPRNLYLAIGFFQKNDIRSIVFYLIKLDEAKKHLTIGAKGKTVFRIKQDEADELVKENRAIKI